MDVEKVVDIFYGKGIMVNFLIILEIKVYIYS